MHTSCSRRTHLHADVRPVTALYANAKLISRCSVSEVCVAAGIRDVALYRYAECLFTLAEAVTVSF